MNFKQSSRSRFEQLGRVGAVPERGSVPRAATVQRPRKQYAPLEARILFDAAGMAAADHQIDNTEIRHIEAQRVATEQAKLIGQREHGVEKLASTPAAPSRGNTVVVIDSRVINVQTLLQDVDPNAIVRIIGADEDGLQVVSDLLESTGNVSSLQIVSHGQAGSIRLGNAALDSAALNNSSTSAQLQGWRSDLTAEADILILGCDVAKGSKGQEFVQKLADLTHADISASTDDTGATALGGNWVLEFNVGQRDSTFAFSERAISEYSHLLPATPTTQVNVPAASLIGSAGNDASVTFSNNTGTVGYAPFVTVGFKSTGNDPDNVGDSTTREGVVYQTGSAKLNSGALAAEYVLRFNAGGQVVADGIGGRPSLLDNLGAPLVFNASDYGLAAGDQLVIWQLPFGSYTPGQPAARIDFKFDVGDLADSANTAAEGGLGVGRALPIASKGFFLLGNNSAPGTPPVIEAAASTAATKPQWYTTQYVNSSRELEQVPGANDKQRFQAELNIAPGQTVLSNGGAVNANPGLTTNRFVSRLSIPPNVTFNVSDIKLTQGPGSGAAELGGAGSNSYFVVDKITGASATQNPNGTWSSPNGVEVIAIAAANTTIAGSPTLQLEYYVPDDVIDDTLGTDIPQSFDARHTGNLKYKDGDDSQNAPFVADPAPITVNYQTIQVQKSVSGGTPDVLAAPLGDGGVNPTAVRSGDVLTYTLNIQVGDYYGLRNVVVTDVLPDGVDFNVGSMNITLANVNGQGFTQINNVGAAGFMTDAAGTLGTYTVPIEGGGTLVVGGAGKQALQLNLSNALSGQLGNAGVGVGATQANSGDLLGDAFGTAAGQGRTDVRITYTGTVRDTYRQVANGSVGSLNLLENDVLKNDVRVHGNLLKNTGGVNAAAVITAGVINSDTSSASVSIKDGAMKLEIYAINGDTTFAKSGGKPLIAAGDNVTYRIRYDLAQGDFNDLKLTAFLPDPIFKATDMNADGTASGTAEMTRIAVGARAALDGSLGSAANWAQSGAYTLGPAHNNALIGGSDTGGVLDTPTLGALAVDDATGGNRLQFSLGNASRTTNPGGSPNSQTPAQAAVGQKIDLLFTVKAQDGVAFADDLLLTAQSRETGNRSVNGGVTTATPLPDDRIVQFKLISPTLAVTHGLIATGGAGGAAGDQNGVVSGLALPGAALVSKAGNAGSAPITGLSPTNAITSGAALNSNITGVDSGDAVRGALSIVNTSRAGAYDVRTTAITPPPGYRFASDDGTLSSAANNVKVMRGDGEVLVAGVDYNFVGNKIEFVDKDRTVVLRRNGDGSVAEQRAADTRPDAVLLSAFDSDGNTRTDGQNVLIVTYDMVVDNVAAVGGGVNIGAISASNTTSTIGIDQYAASNNSILSFGAAAANIINAAPVTDNATSKIATPTADIRWTGDATIADKTPTTSDTSATQTTGGNAVIGEAGFFDILVTLPEGTAKNFSADINLPPGLKLDPTYNAGAGVQIFTAANSDINDGGASQLSATWTGVAPAVISIAAITPATGALAGTIGQPGVGMRVNFGDLVNPQDNVANNNQFVIRVRAIVDNTRATDAASPSGSNQAHNPTPPVGAPAEPNGPSGNQAGILRTTTSSSRYDDNANALTGLGGVVTRVNDTTTANDPTITILEPIVTTVVTVAVVDIDPLTAGDQPGTEADENDIVEYTITLTNPGAGSINAYDLNFSQLLPTQVDTVSIVSALKGATNVASQFELVGGNTVQTLGGAAGSAISKLDLTPGESLVLKVRARANSSAAAGPTFSSTASTQWTSVDSANNLTVSQDANERTGADGLLAGALTALGADIGAGTTSGTGVNQATNANAFLNDYRSASRADVPVLALQPVLSRIGGLTDTSPLAANNAGGDTKDGSPLGGTAQSMAVGEVTRFRMVVRVPAGVTPNLVLQPTLPAGYTFLNDSTARVALVSDSGSTASGLAGNGVAAQQGDGTGTGSSAAFGSIQNDLTSANFNAGDPRAAGTTPTASITPNVATNGASLVAPRFELGNLTNSDNDTDFEYVVIEFNAVVNNVPGNQTGTNLDTRFTVLSGPGVGTVRDTSNITRDVVVEPNIPTVTKSVIDVQQSVGSTVTAQGAVENTITAKSSFTVSNAANTAPAYNVALQDGFADVAGANDLAVQSVKIGATTYTPGTLPAGVTLVSTATGYTLNVDKLDPGTVVEVIYRVDVPVNASVAATPTTNNASVTWSGLPDAAGWSAGTNRFAGSAVGADGTSTGERDGTGGLPASVNPADQTGPLNNYRAVDSAGFGTIAGTLWDDTNTANGTVDGGEKLLDSLTVTLNWAGADGIFGNADDRNITTMTDAAGAYKFGALPGDDASTPVNEGKYRITVPTGVVRGDSGDGADNDTLTNRFDRTDGATGGLNVADLSIVEGTATVTRDFGYLQPNDPPQNSIGGSTTFPVVPIDVNEDNPLAFAGTNTLTIADPDGGRGDGLLSTTLTVTNGTLALTPGATTVRGGASGTTTITIEGTQAQINTALASLVYTPTNNYAGTATLTITTNDRGQGGHASGDATLPREPGGAFNTLSPDALFDTDVVSINVKPISDAPRLTVGTGGGQNTSPVAKGTGLGNDNTQTVAGTATGLEDSLIPLGLGVVSADPTSPETITSVTVTGVPAGWQLVSSGTSPVSFTASALGDVFTIPASELASLSLRPVADLNSTGVAPATLTVTATSQDGGGNPTASTTGTLTIGVTPVNDRPVVNDVTPIVLAAITEGTANSPVQTVGTLFNPRFSDPKDTTQPNGADAMVGVFVTGSAANPTTEGAWEYFGGAAWVAIPAATSDASAIYLPNSAQLRFTPVNSNYSGTPGQLTVRLVENDQTPAGGIVADVLNGAANGTAIGNSIDALTLGQTRDISGAAGTPGQFATGRVSEELKVGIVVTPVSDAPRLTLGNPAGVEAGNPTTTGVQTSPVAPAVGNDATQAVTGSVKGLEDTPIPLGISVAAADTSNPEAISTVTITGIPAGWVIKDGAGNDITAAAATGLTPAQLVNATITAPTDANSVGPAGTTPAATLTIVVTSQDGAAPAATTTGTLNVVVTLSAPIEY